MKIVSLRLCETDYKQLFDNLNSFDVLASPELRRLKNEIVIYYYTSMNGIFYNMYITKDIETMKIKNIELFLIS